MTPSDLLRVNNADVVAVLRSLRQWVELDGGEECEWLGEYPQSGQQPQTMERASITVHTFARAACATANWKFVDDIAWQLSKVNCSNGNRGILVEVHSELRAGRGDAGINRWRVSYFLGYLKNEFKDAYAIFPGGC